MAPEVTEAEATGPVPAARPRRPWWRSRRQAALLAMLALLLTGLAGALWWIDTPAGHRYLARRITAVQFANGLRVTVGRIDGSIYSKAVLHDVAFDDLKGRFAAVPLAFLDWYPLAWINNRLDIDRLHIPAGRLDRKPVLRPSRTKKSILPKFDIRIFSLRVDRLDLGKEFGGAPHRVLLKSNIEIRSGRALVDLTAAAFDTADGVRLSLDSNPDANRFDLDALVAAPRGGLMAHMSGLNRPFALRVDGKGDWHYWKGRAVLAVHGVAPSRLDLIKREASYHIRGEVAGPLVAKGGIASSLIGSTLHIDATGGLENRIVQGDARLGGARLRVDLSGGIDLGHAAFDLLTIDARLHGDNRALGGATSDGLRLRARLSGPFDRAAFEYLIDARSVAGGKLRVEQFSARGEGHLVPDGATSIPLNISARRIVTGQQIVDPLLVGASIKGLIQLAGTKLTSQPIRIRSSGIDGALNLNADFKSGRVDSRLTGGARGIEIPGLGRVDLDAVLTANAPPGGKLALGGRVGAWMRRLDNAFLSGLAQGLPQATSDLALDGDGRLLFRNLQLHAPAIQLSANGLRDHDGQYHFTGGGTHSSYGPLTLTLDGKISQPHVDLMLARPMDALGLANVHAVLTPGPERYDVVANGNSRLGPFTGTAAILIPHGGRSHINVDNLVLGDTRASGVLSPETGGLSGQLAVTGPARGTVNFALVDAHQQVGIKLALDGARFAGPPQIGVGRGQIDATAVLIPGATTLDASVQIRGLRYGTALVGRLTANAHIVDGSGTAKASLTSQRGRLADLQLRAAFTPDAVKLDASGTIDRQPVALSGPAVFMRVNDGWRLNPAELRYRGGKLQLGGELGGADTHVQARLDHMPLAILDMVNSDLGFGGVASGNLSYSAPRGGVPAGQLSLRVRGLTRSGLALSSTPIDAGINAVLTADRAAIRAVMANGTAVVGRAQALITPLGTGSLLERLEHAPLRAQLRYNGNADTLWRLTNFELFTLSGPASISADMGGTLADPVIRGAVQTDDATLQSPVTGMVLTHLVSHGVFEGDRLTLDKLSAATKGGGSLVGEGQFVFSATRGLGIDLSARLDRALVLDRDDIGATVSGPIHITSDGDGGLIAGTFDVDSSRFTMGKAAAVAAIPELRVVEINRRGQELEAPRALAPWRLAIKANAPGRLAVTGLGMQSEWSADLNIGGTVVDPALTGTASLVRGNYDFAGKRFELREGLLRFNGERPINPALNIRADADLSTISATITITGTSAKPLIAFTSTPALPQDELLSRILFGTSITSLSAPEAIQLASAIAAFQGSGGGLDPINAVRRVTGLSRLRVLPADATTGQKTSIAAGKDIGRSVYVELITDGQGYSATRVEYQITRWLSLLGSVSTVGRQSVNARVTKQY